MPNPFVRAAALALILLMEACANQTLPSSGDAQTGSATEGAASDRAPDAPKPPASSACAGLDACACRAAAACKAVTEACYCPSDCDPGIRCICGGGRFLSCASAN